jgi:hypothetical protein
VEGGHGVRLLEEGVRRPVRRGEQDDAPRVRRKALDDGGGGGGRRRPEEENRACTLEGLVDRLGCGEVARYDLDGRGQLGRRRSARERAHRYSRAQELGDQLAPDPAGGSRHEDGRSRCGRHPRVRSR